MKLTALPAAVVVLLAATAAMAQDTVPADALLPQAISALAPVLISGIATLLGAALTWAATKVSQSTGIKIEQQRRDQLHKGIMTSVEAVLLPLLTSGRVPTAKEIEAALRNVPSTVLTLNPDAAKALGAGVDKIGEIAKAKAADVIATWSQSVVTPIAAPLPR